MKAHWITAQLPPPPATVALYLTIEEAEDLSRLASMNVTIQVALKKDGFVVSKVTGLLGQIVDAFCELGVQQQKSRLLSP